MIFKLLNNIIIVIGVAFFFLVSLIATFQHSSNQLFNPLTLLCGSVLLFILLVLFLNYFQIISKRLQRILFYLFVGLIIFTQFTIILSTHNSPFTDTGYIYIQAQNLSHNVSDWNYYFKIYPNNVNIAIFWSFIYRFFNFFHIVNQLRATYIIQLLMLDGAILFTSYTVKKHINVKLGNILLFSLLLYLPLTLFTEWIYNDSISSTLVILLLGLLCRVWYSQSRFKYFWFFLAALDLAFTFILRQNSVVIIIALLITIVLMGQTLRQKFVQISILIATVIVVYFGSSVIQTAQRYERNNQVVTPATRYINMGLNPNTSGQIDGNDAWLYEQPGRTPKEKNRLYLSSIKRRLLNYSVGSLSEHFLKKATYMYGTGLTIQDFFYWYAGNKNNLEESILDRFGVTLVNGFQFFYILLSVMTFVFLWRHLKNKRSIPPVVLFSVLGVLGVCSFQVGLWEVRDRYSLLAVPFTVFIFSYALAELDIVGWISRFGSVLKQDVIRYFIISTGLLVFGYLSNYSLTTQLVEKNNVSIHQPYVAYAGQSDVKIKAHDKLKITFDVETTGNTGIFYNSAYSISSDSKSQQVKKYLPLQISLMNTTLHKSIEVDSNGNTKANTMQKGKYVLTLTNPTNQAIYTQGIIDIGKADFSFNSLYRSISGHPELMPVMTVARSSQNTLVSKKQYNAIFTLLFVILCIITYMFRKKDKILPLNKSKI